MLILSLLACGYGDCGDLKYAVLVDSPQFDQDGDGYLDLEEACGADYGSFGFSYAPEGFASLLFDPSQWDMTDAAALAYDYTPISQIVFRADHLAEGATFGIEAIDGFGMHKPRGAADYITTAFPIAEAEIEVLGGPRDGAYDGVDWRLRVHMQFGAPEAGAPGGWQTVDAEDWFNFSPALGSWADWGVSTIYPPDAG